MYSLNLTTTLIESAKRTPDKAFLLDSAGCYTYQQVLDAAGRFATLLEELNVRPGETIALLMGNTFETVAYFYGALLHGAIVAPILPMWPGPEVAHVLADTGAVVFVAWEPLINPALAGFQQAGTCHHLLIANLPGSTAAPEPCERLDLLLSRLKPRVIPAPTRPDNPAVVIYTSGTTGRPKGVLLSHFNLYFIGTLMTNDFWQVNAADILLFAAPLGNIFGQALLHCACQAGASLSMAAKPELELMLQAIDHDHVTFLAGASPLATLLLYSPATARRDLSSLKRVLFSGSALLPQIAEQFCRTFNVELILGYGLTEGVPIAFANAADARLAPSGSVGRPAWGTQVRIVDEAGQDVPTGEVGEIIARGSQVCLGYLNQPDANQQAFRDGWLHTGDAGRLDAEGYLFISGRLKEVIKVQGYSVAPIEIELILAGHPAVAEVAVIGLHHRLLDERVKAFVTLKPGASAEPDELINYCHTQLAAYKCPRWIEIMPSLPRSASGKIDKKALSEKEKQ